jgi:hypothetical protein
LSFNHYFLYKFKLANKNVVMVTLTTGVMSVLHVLLNVEKFTKVFYVCADRLWSGPRLLKAWEILVYIIVISVIVIILHIFTEE